MNAFLRSSRSSTPRAALRFSSLKHNVVLRRNLMTIKSPLYTAHATAHGKGRDGEVKSDDDAGLSVRLATPKSLGGNGDGQNPEQLLAMGYAACFLTALQVSAGKMGKSDQAKSATVHANVHIGDAKEVDGYGLSVDLKIDGVQDQDLIDAAHQLCPYSRAFAHGAVVNVSK
ncbi:OsmC-like protein [Stereum hirsutum FP-91666 SS1]|uniref:OsmC-like protein n=1 Tax=Stereum hirsutum (strain FP-91666) TaxID=721885 RepID=UPI0004449DA7|nr:OsmC-like protein [Stereum hirsutum FP-91666 SS1]EIM82790.1 OsmC-like protein [Stereum hirsutum FP-91666 SS1]